MQKVLRIDGKDVGFKATALTPRIYRHVVGRDMMADMAKIRESIGKANKNGEQLNSLDLEIFENVAYVMAKQYDANVPDTADEWLDMFNTFSIYDVLPEIINLWQVNEQTTSVPKKK